MGEDKGEGRPERFFCHRVDEREEGRNDESSSKIREKGEGGEVLDGASHLTGDDRCSSSGRHDKTEHQALRKVTVSREPVDADIGGDAESDLRNEDDPMPFMEAQVERVDLAEGKKEHKEDEPRECRLQRQKEFIAQGSDEHREPEGVGIEEFSHKSEYSDYSEYSETI